MGAKTRAMSIGVCSFYATPSANQTIPNTTHTKVTMDTEVLDTHGAYDTSTSQFTVPAGMGGLYEFSYNARIPLTNGEEMVMALYVDGANVPASNTQMYPGANGSYYHASTTMANLTAGQTAEFRIYLTSTGTRTTNNLYCFFSGNRING